MYAALVIGSFFGSLFLVMFKRGTFWKALGALGMFITVLMMNTGPRSMNVERGPDQDPGLGAASKAVRF